MILPDGCVRCSRCEGFGWTLFFDTDLGLPNEICSSCEGRGWIDEND